MTTKGNDTSAEAKPKRDRARRRVSWPPIYKRIHRSGQVGFVVDLGLVNGKRDRRTFSSKQAAETFAAQARIARENEGTAAFSLSADSRLEAAKCLGKLRPWNATLTEAVDHYVEHVLKYRNAPPIAEIVQQLLKDVTAAGRRQRTIDDLKARLGQFANTFGTRQLSAVTLPELQEWLNDPELSPRTKINYAVKLSQLFNFAIGRGWADMNLAKKLSRPAPEDKEPGIFTVKQTATLLGAAPEFGLLPYVALGLFAGLRPTEAQRLDWSAVKLTERAIIVGAEIAKKRMRRVVEVGDTLAAWLAAYAKERGPVVDTVHFRERLEALQRKAKILPWPKNGLRHSFGSYHLAMHGDQVRTAAQMGHQDSNILHNHYKALVTKAEAQHFWALEPEGEANKVVPMQPGSEQGAPAITATEEASEKMRQQSHT